MSPAGQQKGEQDDRYPCLFVIEKYLAKLKKKGLPLPKAIVMEESHMLLKPKFLKNPQVCPFGIEEI